MSEDRKKDHIHLALNGQSFEQQNYGLHYEPLLAGPVEEKDISISFMGTRFEAPLWISSMTGGTEQARTINQNLARAVEEFGLGMGLGSCRALLNSRARLEDFDIRHLMPTRPLWVNLGIAQLEQILMHKQLSKLDELMDMLKANGLIVHINPIQEWLQPEGDRLLKAPLWTLDLLCEKRDFPLMVKEVGQGMGPLSLKELLKLPIQGLELAGFGGTNFAAIEIARQNSDRVYNNSYLAEAGHTSTEMVNWLNDLLAGGQSAPEVIVSGGIQNPMQGYAMQQKLRTRSLIGLAGAVLKHALGDYTQLQQFLSGFVRDYRFVANYFRGPKQ